MSPNDDAPEETYLDTEEGSAGPAQRRTRNVTRGLADEAATLSDEDLDARQRGIGERRKQGGPPLDARVTRGTPGVADVEDVPPTECEEPPEE
jgi:hypothetical protein